MAGLLDILQQQDPNQRGLLSEIKATPRNGLLGALADYLASANRFAAKPFGYDNPPGEMLSGLLGGPAIAKTLDRLSYGEPLTNMSTANVPLLKPETADAALMLAPSAVLGGRKLAGLLSDPRLAEAVAAAAGPAYISPAARSLQGGSQRGAIQSARPRLISSQRYIDDDIVASKLAEGDFTVKVTPPFEIGGEKVQAITDGHHRLRAAADAGKAPKFITDSAQTNDRVNLLKQGKIDDFLQSAYHDSPWYFVDTGVDIW